MAVLMTARVLATKALTLFTMAVFGVEVADILGLLKSHNFASACGALAAALAVVLNLWNGRKDRRVVELERLAFANRTLIDSQGATLDSQGRTIAVQGATIEREQTARMAIEAELAQASEELLRRGHFLAAHSGNRITLRHAVPPAAIDVLVVDDDAMVLRSMERVLSRYGFHVEAARGLVEARNLIAVRDRAQRRYDFALLDLVLPDASVDDVLDLACEICQGTDVVVVTGMVPDHQLDRAKACTTAVLVKPIELDELLALLGSTPEQRP